MRVLLVEDDRDLGPFLKKGLENEGHTTEWLVDPEAALDYAAEASPDLILLDLGSWAATASRSLPNLRPEAQMQPFWSLQAQATCRPAFNAWTPAPTTAC